MLVLQLAIIVNAYCPSLLFHLPAPPVDVAAAGAAAAGVVAGISEPLLRMVKYAWGAGFFIAAFACNCLKTAADRRHSWAPQNRCVAVCMVVQGTAVPSHLMATCVLYSAAILT